MVLWSQKVLLKTLYQIQYGILFAVELSFSNGRYFRVGRYFREGGGGGGGALLSEFYGIQRTAT